MNRISPFLLSIFLCISCMSFAKDMPYPEVIKKLNTLLSSKQYARAFQLSDEYTFEYGGLPEFDLLSGFAAYGNRRYQEAVFAFERVTTEVPDSYLALYYLAQTYQKLDNLPAAIAELNRLLTKPLLDNQKENATRLLNRITQTLIDKDKSWSHSISGMMAFDSNINSGTEEELIFLPTITAERLGVDEILLADSSRKTRDLTYALNYQANYKHPISQNEWVKVTFGANHVDYLEFNQYQRNILNFDLAYSLESQIGTLSVSGFTRPLWLNGTHYRTEIGASTHWQKELSKNSGLMSSISYSVLNNSINPTLDLSRTRLALSYLFKTAQIHSLMTHWQQDVSDNSVLEYNDKSIFGVMYQLTWPISDSLISNNSFMIEQHEYVGIHPIFLIKRSEIMSMFSSQLMFNSTDKLSLKLHLNVQDKNSNENLFSYDRVEIGASWQYKL